MLDLDEPDTPTQETNEQPAKQPAPRRRRAASRAAGPPSSAPDAPAIERVNRASESASADSAGTEITPPVDKAAKKPAAKRTAKKPPAEAPPADRKVAKTTRKRTAKKTAAMASEVSPNEAAAPSTEMEEAAPPREDPPPSETDVARVAPLQEEPEAAPDQPAPEGTTPEQPASGEPSVEEAAPQEAGVREAPEDTAVDSEADEGRRRRRRRGGRRRRRSTTDEAASAEAEQPEEDEAGEVNDDSDLTADGPRRRRRRRRRRGEEAAPAADDPMDTVLRVREPRRQDTSDEVVGIDGSTRMEAKRQRRREGREAGRRRTPVLSEAEFLARRESVVRKMIIRQREELAQIAVLEDDILVEHYVDRATHGSLIGNVYLGRVQNVLPSMEAAFVDIGRGRNGVIYAGEIDWDYFGAEGQNRKVEKVLKSGQTILVQVTKDPVGAKGARLTNHVSIPGRYIVYAPGGHLSGISRKLPESERRRLKEILSDLVGESASVIVRTAAEGASEEELVRDVNRLKAQWEDIERKVATGNAPQLLYAEPDLTVRIVRDLFTEDFSELIISGNGGMTDAYDSIEAYVSHVAPHLKDRMRRWEGDHDLFAEYRLDEQIAKALERKVFLPSGGSLIIDRTEAMTVIDVNTGKFTGTGGNLEATVTSNNLEAAEEIVRQLRLRDIGGIIVIDFIDMVLPSNRELLLRRLVECLGRDRTRHQVAEITSLGLVQMTRKRIGTGLLEAFSTECPHCHGRGYELHDMPVESHKHADGGARDSRTRDRRSNAQSGSGKATDNAISAEAAGGSNDGAPEERPARSRRSSRSRRAAAGPEQAEPQSEPAEPQSEPAVLS
jgi:ribonuclease E